MGIKLGLRPGHGGSDPGAVNKDGTKEKDLTLQLTLAVGAALTRSGFDVVYSRTEDKNSSIETDVKMFIGEKVSQIFEFHFNAGGGTGSEIYAPARGSIAATNALEEAVLSKYFKWRGHKVMGASRSNVYTRTIKSNKFQTTYNFDDYFGTIRQAWKVGISTDYLEICFIDNDTDLKVYRDNADAIAEGLAEAICKAYGVTYKAPDKPVVTPSDPVIQEGKYAAYKLTGEFSTASQAHSAAGNDGLVMHKI